MLFNSFGFIFLFLPITLFIARLLRGQTLLVYLALCSLSFYAFSGRAWFLAPMAFTILLDFFLAQRIEQTSSRRIRKTLLLVSLTGNLGLLFYFKYVGLFASSIKTLIGISPEHAISSSILTEVLLPVGISFYTFQTVAYVIDVYRAQCPAEKNLWLFVCFVSFYPHLIAGPLTRHNQLIPALENISRHGIRPQWHEGIYLFILGLAKKVLLGDGIARIIDPLLANPASMDTATAWMSLFGFSLQIYFDFSGYSDMAIGLARLYGIDLPQNFNVPYRATNPQDFWRRWHITLSIWLRDYLYFPLGGSRKGPSRTQANLIITMVLGGLWHGASWNFAIWGFYHGSLLILYHRSREWWDRLPMLIQWASTQTLITFGWVFFRSPTFLDTQIWLHALFASSPDTTAGAPFQAQLILLCLIAGIVSVLGFRASGFKGYSRLSPILQVAMGIVAVATTIMMSESSKFLYFQF